MTIYVSILRGTNVAGHNLIKMEVLKTLCAGIGFTNVHTYIQSGNIIYQCKKTDTKKLNALIKSAIQAQCGFDVPVMTLTHEALKKIAAANPFLGDAAKDTAFLHVTFLADTPQPENLAAIIAAHYQPDLFRVIDKAVYLYCPNGYGNTKLTNNFFESKLKTAATTRNWKTTNELVSIAEKISAG
jgi:uncharacterized protein (DUF1697 family)